MSEVKAPLQGIRVVDFTQFLAGPFGSMILGDLGAEVIKVETTAGELARHLPPHFVDGDSLYYAAVNRNKRSLSVDLKSEEGRAIVMALIEGADVVFENFRPGVLKRLGFDCQTIRTTRPELIWCAISGFGQGGPARDLPAYDMVIQALSGGMSLTGEPDGHAVRAGIPIGDLTAGMYGVMGVLAALVERARTGVGREIDVSMLDCQISLLTYQAAYCLHSGAPAGRQGRGHDSIPTYRSFRAKDGRDVVVTANTQEMWVRLCEALDAPHLSSEPRFISNAARFTNRRELEPLLEGLFEAKDAAVWMERLRAHDVPVGEVQTLDRALADPQVRYRQMVLELEAEGRTPVRVAGDPLKLATPALHGYPPALGADTDQILRDIGLSSQQIQDLAARGIVGVS